MRQKVLPWRTLVFAALLLSALPAHAQVARAYRVASVAADTPEVEEFRDAFHAGMRDLGYVEGKNVIYETRKIDRDMQGAAKAIDELIATKPDVMLANEHLAQIMRSKTTTIPIVLGVALDPVRAGLAQSLRRPGTNVTGNAQMNDLLPAKHVELIKEILPKVARIGQFVDTTQSGCKLVEEATRQAASRIGATVIAYNIKSRADIEQAFVQVEKARPDVLMPCPSLILFNHRDLLFESAIRLRIPFTSFGVSNVPQGVLFAYAASIPALYRRAALYVDKILKGANPADLPIEQPTKFDLVVNLRTAKAFGLTVPASVLLRADRVIE
jgi:putative ABC transport system substrate-binding protein